MKTVLLINVGTPQSPSPEDVGIYLREFLMDESILQIPRPFRDLLVKGFIVPFRKTSSAKKYQKIWTSQGSPLMVESETLKTNLEKFLGESYQVVLAMQVGKPSLKAELSQSLSKNHEIYFCPLYPQYATATTGGALKLLKETKRKTAKSKQKSAAKVQILTPFFQQDWFIQSQALQIRDHLQQQDHLLLSYHGLPVSQLKNKNPDCLTKSSCCVEPRACEKNCYKAQCLRTSEKLKNELGLPSVTVSFQSRLGPAQWIEPSTEKTVLKLAREGVKHLKVACPSFVSDCLETLEEIAIDLKEKFLHAGGETFQLIPCVSGREDFVRGLGEEIFKLSEQSQLHAETE